MPTLSSKLIRVELNAALYSAFVDEYTASVPKFPLAGLTIEAVVTLGKVNTTPTVMTLSNVVSLSCIMKTPGAGGTAPASDAPQRAVKTVLAASFDTPPTWAEWKAGTGRHVAFVFSEAQINGLEGYLTDGRIWVIFNALLNSGEVIPLRFGLMDVVQDGYGTGGTVPLESLARFVANRPDLVNLTGGTTSCLDTVPTAADVIATGAVFFLYARPSAGVGTYDFGVWRFQDSTAATDAAGGVVRPTDYHGTTNARAWIRML